jgi:hypothetical protein
VKRIALVAAAVLAAAFFCTLWILVPPRRVTLQPSSWPSAARTAAGVMHVHTVASDGSGSPDEVAAAAARAGLQFVILTDHGDGTRAPRPPVYRSGVLCLDAVEISTAEGHYIALGLPQTPYPLGGDPRDVIQDVRRLGGFGIAAHPDSRKPALQWHEWTAPFDAIEWLNADSEWRDASRRRKERALATYLFRPVETLGSLLDRPDLTILRWDTLTQRRRVVGVAGTDAHARVGWQESDASGYRKPWFLRIPSYEVSFRAFALRVNLSRPLSGDAGADALILLQAIRAGHLYTAIDAVASPAALEFSATSSAGSAEQGDRLEPGGPVNFRARVNASTGGTIVLRKNGALLTQHPVPELTFVGPPGAGVYRIEVLLASAPGQPPIPWIVSNPIYVEPAAWDLPPAEPVPAPSVDRWKMQGGPWHAEHDTGSTAAVLQQTPPDGSAAFAFRLAAGERAGQYAALVMSSGNALSNHARFAFTARADAPMRVSLQARRPSGARWQRSIYLDTTAREFIVPFTDMKPVGPDAPPHFIPAEIDTVLFVVDTTNTAPGTAGRFEVSDLKVETIITATR